ncbi:MAG: AAC(3) family N-acetyltransferase [Spirochaetota bacterium]
MDRTGFLHRFVDDARTLGVRPGGVLLVHSSLGAFSRPADGDAARRVPGGATTVIDALLASIDEAGTLLLPALSYEFVTRSKPVFDARTTPSNVGAIPEAFRRRSGVIRSLHPTHSVCATGPRAAELTADHIADSTPCGGHSPFHRLPEVGGQILMLGCSLMPNTSMHAIEELVEPRYLFGEPYECSVTDADGATVRKRYRPHGFRGWQQRYDRVADILSPPALRTGAVAGAPSHLIEARDLWTAVKRRLREDELAFVARLGAGPGAGEGA